MPPPPYGVIWEQIQKGGIVPFFGAGASLSERAPGATFPPSGGELAETLAANCGFPTTDPAEKRNLALVSSYYEQVGADRPALRDKLRGVFDPTIVAYDTPPAVFRLCAKLPCHFLAVTTNYDVFIERALQAENHPFHLVVHTCDDPANANAVHWWRPGDSEPTTLHPNQVILSESDLQSASIIYKMHGSVCRRNVHDSFVISEEDYVGFLATQSSIPNTVLALLQTRRFLFLGYSLKDWNLRVLLSQLQLTNSKRLHAGLRSWAVQRSASALDEALWTRRNVNVYSLEVGEFARQLAQTAGIAGFP